MPRVTDLGFTQFNRKEPPEPETAYEEEVNDPAQELPPDSVPGEAVDTLNVNKLISGTINSKQITLDVKPEDGDVYIAAGKTDFTNTVPGFILGIDDSDSDTAKFYIGDTTSYLNWDGSTLTIAGVLTASSINIPDTTTANSFHVDEDGNVWTGCNVADFVSDNDNADTYILKDGSIKLQSAVIIGGIIKTGAVVEAGQDGVIMDTDGVRGYSAVLGKVFDLPTDGSAPSFASGIIEETIFEIDTSGVMRTSETVGDGTANSAGILINNTGLYACEASQDLADANIKILINGEATISGNIEGGKTTYGSGTGYFLGYHGGEWKLDMGDSDNYMRWDGSNLIIKGNLELTSAFTNINYTVANLPIPPTTEGFNDPSGNE